MTEVFLEALTNISLRKVEGVQDTILGYSKISTLTTYFQHQWLNPQYIHYKIILVAPK